MTTPSVKVEYQFRGDADALRTLREVLEAAGVFVQVDHEYKNTVWPEAGLVVGALLVPAAERVEPELEAAVDAG